MRIEPGLVSILLVIPGIGFLKTPALMEDLRGVIGAISAQGVVVLVIFIVCIVPCRIGGSTILVCIFNSLYSSFVQVGKIPGPALQEEFLEFFLPDIGQPKRIGKRIGVPFTGDNPSVFR